jgi:ribosomal-protein-alanine N-acetyltransferase
LPYRLRLIRREDITQVAEIDREAFSTQWPPTNYRHELQNSLAHYTVACDDRGMVEETTTQVVPKKGLSGLITGVRQLFRRSRFYGNEPPSRQYIVGFAGFWITSDEAHMTSIAVRESYHRQGLGELLLISNIDLAVQLKARIITLEVRASNTAAQALYSKYGFNQVGLRRGYYIDNKEAAVLMSTEDISAASFQSHFQQLKQAHSKKLSIAQYEIAL